MSSSGFLIHLQRVRQERRRSKAYARTVGRYACYWDGVAIPGLEGQMVERQGPGDNTTAIGNRQDLRIRSGRYPLAVQNGTKYKTFGYHTSESHTALPRPGLLLLDTQQRSAILIHPGMDYVWSVGCLNPGSGLVNASSGVVFTDSRRRVMSLIDEMRTRMGARFPRAGGTRIPDAAILIEGEPE